MPYMFLREADKRMLKDFSDKLEEARRASHMSYNKLAAMARVNVNVVGNMIYNEGGTIRTFLRLIDAMDYDFVLVKRQKRRTIFDVEGAAEQLYKTRKIANKSKTKEREEKRNLQEELDKAEFENDFLNDK